MHNHSGQQVYLCYLLHIHHMIYKKSLVTAFSFTLFSLHCKHLSSSFPSIPHSLCQPVTLTYLILGIHITVCLLLFSLLRNLFPYFPQQFPSHLPSVNLQNYFLISQPRIRSIFSCYTLSQDPILSFLYFFTVHPFKYIENSLKAKTVFISFASIEPRIYHIVFHVAGCQ